jgi:hypothetical protein
MIILLTALAATAQAPAAQPAPKDNDPIICTRDAAGSEVGTHMRPKKVCMRRSDRDFIENQARSTVRGINNNGNERLQYVPQPRP